jgi:hypothetical protein
MSTRKRDWRDRPAPANREVAVAAACNGLHIGKCLQEALDALTNDEEDENLADEKDADGEEGQPLSKNTRIKLGKNDTDCILRAFGEAVADTSWKSSSMSSSSSSPLNGSNNSTLPSCPPVALLRGRLDHYNRVGKNWRIVVDDLQLKERAPLQCNQRKRRRRSLWNVDKEKQVEISISGTLHIHAYDDL